MLKVGLTGNIATGKTTVAEMFKEMGAQVIDADEIARQVVMPDKPAWHDIVKNFGSTIIRDDNTIDRRALGKIVFGSEEKRQLLNSITHPRIIEDIRKSISDLEKSGTGVAIIEASLIVEKGGMKDIIDKLIVVTADEDIQVQRLSQRDELTKEEISGRLRSQMPSNEKVKYADFVIDNSGSKKETRKQVESVWKQLLELAGHCDV